MKKIKLTQGKYVLVDDEDFDFLNKFKWYAKKSGNTFYAVRLSKPIYLHRVIMDLDKQDVREVDHIDGNGLNCKKNNLRVCTHAENVCNTKGRGEIPFKGVTYVKCKRKNKTYNYIVANIRKDGKTIYLGVFNNIEQAALAYNDAAIKYHGEFANLNKLT